MQNTKRGASNPPAYLIGSVDKALELLLSLHEHKELRVRDVARELGVARSTAHRLLSTLAWRGFVTQSRESRAYLAGPKLVEIALASIKELDVRRRAHDHMARLSRLLHETVNLIALEDDNCRFIDGVEGDQMVRTAARTGALVPAYATSGGKVLLAALPENRVRELYQDGLHKITPKTNTDFHKLEVELASVRKHGYALNIEESQVGLWAVAVPVLDHSGRTIAALAVSTPSIRMEPSDIAIRVQALREAVAAIGESSI